MATFERVNGAAAAMEQVGRDLVWVQNSANMSVTATFEAAIQALQDQATITVIGAPTAAGVTCGVEGMGTVPGGWSVVTLSGLTFA